MRRAAPPQVQLDAITHNELGDPDALAEVKGRPDVTSAELERCRTWAAESRYDAVAERHITMIATEVGMIRPPACQ